MHEVQETIEINAPVCKVFALLKDIDAYLRLNPFLKIIWIEKYIKEDILLGSKYRIVAICGDRRLDCIIEWIEYEENKKIVSFESASKTKLTLILKEIPKGTLLIHKEEFEIPFEIVFKDEFGEGEIPFWKKILFFTRPDPDIEYTTRAKKIIEKSRNNLKTLLTIIKEKIERE